MPVWKKVLYGFLALIALMIFSGNGAEAADMTNGVIGGIKSATNGVADFVANIDF